MFMSQPPATHVDAHTSQGMIVERLNSYIIEELSSRQRFAFALPLVIHTTSYQVHRRSLRSPKSRKDNSNRYRMTNHNT